jgi:hypothetical protein
MPIVSRTPHSIPLFCFHFLMCQHRQRCDRIADGVRNYLPVMDVDADTLSTKSVDFVLFSDGEAQWVIAEMRAVTVLCCCQE